ncbi:fructoselysine-6-P-deglycase FrlB-like protein [Streptosporangium becharense]|uniref:Fructoselysine-6-P-deglycase FrlB-like protein n=1 Tax=Streptosporangium becharense TaxID=1816182 RepID=A0A7W9IMJ1_9ACTN|nr:SIS domain-containing protein [Streptosporangium becharense]MBB2910357.1 fructoselysine-6-P-deglycase FrlB-like protein [Streptosporangium becharense]MBB5823100.1 fructoselysine-6-P-deglycase FrlB-like protein [Streptosporangium becharense]
MAPAAPGTPNPAVRAPRPVEADFLPTLDHALAQRATIGAFVGDVLADGISDVFFLGCGGSYASSVHAATTLADRVGGLAVHNLFSTDVAATAPARLGPRSLVIASAHSGATPETVAATKAARQAGAKVISLSQRADSPLGRLADLALDYRSERTITSAKQILLSHITWALLEGGGDTPAETAAAVREAYDALPGALRASLDEADEKLGRVAADLAASPFVFVLGAGPTFGAAYLLSMCYLMEMQWKRSASFRAGEFFHGAFEMVEGDAGVITFVGEDLTRPAAERAARFAGRYTAHAHHVDSRDLTLPGVPPVLRAEVAPIALGVLAGRLAEHFEAVTGHSLDERRYMYKVDY